MSLFLHGLNSSIQIKSICIAILAVLILSFPKLSYGGDTFSCSSDILTRGGEDVDSSGKETIRVCLESLGIGNLLESAGASGLADVGNNAQEALGDAGASRQAQGSSDLFGVAARIHAATGTNFIEAMKACKAERNKFIGQVEAAANEIGLKMADPQLSNAAVTCKNNLIKFSDAVEIRVRPVIAEMDLKAKENALGYAINDGAQSVSSKISDALGSNMGMLAVGAGLGYLGSQMLGKKDKDKDGDGGGGKDGFTVSNQESGGQCISYGKDQEKCYTNAELSRMCFGESDNSAMMGYLATQGTDKMKKALCGAFTADTREGAGGDENACHIKKTEYWKDKACESRMTTQCQTSEFGDCRLFNSHHCHNEDEGAGVGSNYCVYRLASEYCNNGGGGMSSPACAWVRQINDAGTNGGTSCLADINQASCFPSAYDSYAALMEACNTMGVGDKDPICKSINSSKLYFSWRNPGTPGGTNADSSQQANNGTNSGEQNLEAAADNKCVKPEANCASVEHRDSPACIDYYCCQPINSASPICRSLSYGTASVASGAGQGSSANRYPAGSLPSDILTYRGESIFTSSTNNSVAQRLCKNGELYDCGALQGFVPKASNK